MTAAHRESSSILDSRPLGTGLRVFPQLRAAHIEEIDEPRPRATFYFAENYDLKMSVVPAHVRRASLGRVCIELAKSQETTLELFEPLWVRYCAIWLLLALVWMLTRRARGIRGEVVFFALENRELRDVFSLERPELRWVVPIATRVFRLVLQVAVTRIAFGTPDSHKTYEPLVPEHTAHRLFLDLLAPRASDAVGQSRTAVFVGALEERKGLPLLLSAWEEVERVMPDASLTIIGDGKLDERTKAWAGESPGTRRFLGPQPRAMIFTLLSQSLVSVAPSQRVHGWREQVNRSIQEALSMGLTIVSSDQTGLRHYLRANGHTVIGTPLSPTTLARAISHSLNAPLARGAVKIGLPAVPGRLAADSWMHAATCRAPSDAAGRGTVSTLPHGRAFR